MRLFAFIVFLVSVFMGTPSVAQQGRLSASDVRASFGDAVQKVMPAVVNIYTTKRVRAQNPFFNDPFFQMFFDDAFTAQQLKSRVEQSLGSGVLVTADGYLITNYHVIEGAESMRVVLADGKEIPARYIDAEPNLDIAILKMDLPQGTSLPYIGFGNSDTLRVGDVVLAIGNPFGVGQSVSMGIVSAVGRTNVGVSRYENFIQTDAAINPGNSGGALIDSTGKLIGINTAIFTRSGGSQGIGFAIPAAAVRNVLESVLSTGKVRRPWFGANGQDITSTIAERLGLKKVSGVIVNDVVEGSPAANAGLKVGDIITALEGKEIPTTASLNARILTSTLNTPLTLTLWRDGIEIPAKLTLTPLPDRKASDRLTLTGTSPLSGYVVEKLTPALNHELGLPLASKGLAIVETPSENTSTFALGLGLQTGDILISINKTATQTFEDIQQALKTTTRTWQVVFQRGGQVFKVAVQ